MEDRKEAEKADIRAQVVVAQVSNIVDKVSETLDRLEPKIKESAK